MWIPIRHSHMTSPFPCMHGKNSSATLWPLSISFLLKDDALLFSHVVLGVRVVGCETSSSQTVQFGKLVEPGLFQVFGGAVDAIVQYLKVGGHWVLGASHLVTRTPLLALYSITTTTLQLHVRTTSTSSCLSVYSFRRPLSIARPHARQY